MLHVAGFSNFFIKNKQMKHILLFIIFSFTTLIHAQGVDFFEGSWHEAVELAKKENKIIFVDAYTPWCHPCKRLKKEIFPQKKAGDYYNENFINLSINLEDWRGLVFSLYYKVNAYPTLLFIDPEGKIILESKGFKNINNLIKLGKKAISKNKNQKVSNIDNKRLYSIKARRVYKKMKKAESSHDFEKYKNYALIYFDLLPPSDSFKREFIKSIYSKNIGNNNTGDICYDLSTRLFNENKSTQNNIFHIKMLTLTHHNDEAYQKIIKALREADSKRDFKTRIELRRYKKYLTRKIQ